MIKFIRLKDNPLYLYFYLIWCLSKTYQYIGSREYTVWEVLWEKILQLFGDNEYNLYVHGTGVYFTLITLLWAGMYTVFDFTLKPNFIRKYKVQPNTNEPPKMDKFQKVLFYSIFNGIFLSPTFLIVARKLYELRGVPDMHKLPSIYTILLGVFLCDLTYEIVFYTTHRSLHHKTLYKYIHKNHHEWTSSQALVAIYAHPVEHIVSNMLPFCAGPIIFGSHIAVHFMWTLYLTLSTFTDHSGYHLPFLKSSEFHDFHHLRFNSNYGGIGLMDSIFGTDEAFRNTIQEKRDRTLWTLKSAHELYPDEENEVKFFQSDDKNKME